jgi:hypothetical protein
MALTKRGVIHHHEVDFSSILCLSIDEVGFALDSLDGWRVWLGCKVREHRGIALHSVTEEAQPPRAFTTSVHHAQCRCGALLVVTQIYNQLCDCPTNNLIYRQLVNVTDFMISLSPSSPLALPRA